MARVEMKIADVVGVAGPDHSASEAAGESGLVVHVGPLAGEIGKYKLGVADLGDYLVANVIAVLLLIKPDDPNRYILVQHNYLRREHTSTKSRKARRADMSRELRQALLDLRDGRSRQADVEGKSYSGPLVFPSPDRQILDPDNLYHRLFRPVLEKSGLRKIRLHDLRHNFGSSLIQSGASILYTKEQMGHSSIQVTVDTYGH
jgi:integrase